MSDDIMQALGRIEAKLDTEIAQSKEHREDDVRRFTDVYKTLESHSRDINQAKGAKGAIMAVTALVAGLVGAATEAIARWWR